MSEFRLNNHQIVPAKLEIPSPPPAFMRRPDVMDHICRLLDQKVTFIVAPLGCGKTCALVECAMALTSPGENGCEATPHVGWLSVDERDDDPEHFWSHVFAALSIAENDNSILENVLPLLQGHIDSDCIDRLAASLFESQKFANTILMLDGIDLVQNEEIDEQLVRFITYSPRGLRFLISARKLSQKLERGAYNQGQLQLGYHDLFFSMSETKNALEAVANSYVMGGGSSQDSPPLLSESTVHTIWDLCEGWPQGIALAIQTLATCIQRGAEFKFTGLSSSVRRYFSSNVTGSVSPELVGVYKVLSVFERFNESLFQVVFEDQEAARDNFREIVTNGDVLVVSCDDEDEWYRFNPLFADWIRRNLQPGDKHGIRRACLAASEWFNDKGYTEEAAKYVLMYVDFKYVSNLVESTSGLKCGIGDADAFVWINQIPSSRFPKSPLMSLLSAWAYNAVGHVKDAEEWLEFFKGAAASSPKVSEEDTAIAVKLLEAKHMAMAGDGQLALKMNEELLLSVRSTEHSLSSLLYQSIGEANARLGRLRVAEEMFLQAQASASVDNTEHHLYFNMFSYAKVRFDLGDFDECEATCRKLIEACPRELVFYNGGFALLALIHIERDLVDEASLDIRGALEGATPYRNVNMYLLSKVAESTLLAAKGNLTGAYEVISESVIYGERTIVPLNYLLTAYFKQSELAAKRGSERDLQVIERKFKLRDAHDNNHRTMFQMVEGKRLQQQGDLEAAAIAYSAAVESAKNAGAAFLEAKAISFLLACGDKGSAPHRAALLTRLIHLADSRGFVRVLLNAGAPMRDILRKYSSSSHANAHTRQFVKGILVKFEQEMHSFQNIQDMQNASIEKLEYLTSREREVLALLNMGMSRKEIADTLSVSLNTAKKHLSNIYAKLGVRNRNQALDSISAVAAPETSKEVE